MPIRVVIEQKWKVTIFCPENTHRAPAASYHPDGTQMRPTRIECEWIRGREHERTLTYRGPRILRTKVEGREMSGVAFPDSPTPQWVQDLLAPYRPLWENPQ
ncbi:hypothetical protein [Mycobacteroides abscessus]|uniref:hypothetical protein n=1 Tax=Mycobacteroides abscessus TaxID=36809 RepID=UPI0009A72109|nr:hypothetical protein [Mycobacteroides abscessus]SKO15472.1 Uncharacterised protein [Mycobacteroides abscessus subsp. bolletii]SKX37315.1 Uncharacterised protein [Mycobacteroides abscessus subsp. bolletii]